MGADQKSVSEANTIGEYFILDLVGSGGLGQVYKAKHRRTKEIVALKRLHDQYQTNKKLLGLFHKEIMIHSQVSHPNCVRFVEACLTPPDAHIVTSFVDGYNCHSLIRDHAPLPPLVACCIMIDFLQGLEHLHCLDIVHTDITPANLMIEKSGRVMLADFGLSSHHEIENYEGIMVGTPGYQAPERLQNAPITTAIDIYGAGIVLYELLRGERLFPNPAIKETLPRMQKIKVDWVQTGNREVDKLLKSCIAGSLAFQPGKRFETPKHFMFAIYQILKLFQIRFTRRAILQWMVEKKLTHHAPPSQLQRIHI
jgi:serine/threonine protein kinase